MYVGVVALIRETLIAHSAYVEVGGLCVESLSSS